MTTTVPRFFALLLLFNGFFLLRFEVVFNIGKTFPLLGFRPQTPLSRTERLAFRSPSFTKFSPNTQCLRKLPFPSRNLVLIESQGPLGDPPSSLTAFPVISPLHWLTPTSPVELPGLVLFLVKNHRAHTTSVPVLKLIFLVVLLVRGRTFGASVVKFLSLLRACGG